MNPERQAILLAFGEEQELLTKEEIRRRSGIRTDMQINNLFLMGALEMKEWQYKVPRQFGLTVKGRSMRDECVVGD